MFLRYHLLDKKFKNAENFSSPSSNDRFGGYFSLSYGWKNKYARDNQPAVAQH